MNRLSVRLLGAVMGVLVMVFLVVTFFEIRASFRQREERLVEDAKEIAQLLVSTIEDIMLAGEHKKLHEDLEHFRKFGHLAVVDVTAEPGPPGLSSPNLYTYTTPIHNRSACYRCHGSSRRLLGVLKISIPLRSAMAAVSENTRRHLFRFSFITAVLAACIWLIVWVFVHRPLNQLMSAMERVGEGNLKVAMTPCGSREWRVVSDRFNRMVQELREDKETIEQLHHAQLSHADRLASLGELSAGLAHEINNPLASIKGAVQVMRDGMENPAHKETLTRIDGELTRMTKTINNLLNYARPQPLQARETDLSEVLDNAFFLVGKPMEEKRIEIDKRIPKGLPMLRLDREQMTQVFVNLFLNAIQAMSFGGRLGVNVKAVQGLTEVRVSDTGPGIPPEHFQKIFEPFFTTKSKGTGLGLAIARRIVKAHGGELSVDRRPEGGTVFKVQLPVSPEAENRGAIHASGLAS